MATINLGNLTFTHKGDYAGGTAYVKNDVVYYATNGNSYIAKTSTTGNAPTSTAHWDLFVAGSSGIWNAGLSLGSANQVVRVNSGANALEFGDLSSDFVKITSGTHSGTELNIDNVFSATYDLYKVYITKTKLTSDWLAMRMRTGGASGTTATNSEYRYGSKMFWRNSSTTGDTGEHAWNDSKFRVGWTTTTTEKLDEYDFIMSDPYSNNSKFSYCMNYLHNDNTYIGGAIGYGTIDLAASTQFTGLNFYQNGGNTWTCNYKVYGIKS